MKCVPLSIAPAAPPFDGDLDPLLPEQLLDRRRRPLQPEQRLMIAILEDALLLRRRGPRASGRCASVRYAEVRRWFSSNDLRWPFSFLNICLTLGLDPAAVRASANTLDETQAHRVVPASPSEEPARIAAAGGRP